MSYFKKNYNQVKNSSLLSSFGKTFLLLVIVFFLFNFNPDSPSLQGQQVQVAGEGNPGFIAKWSLSSSLACYEPKPNAIVTFTPSQYSIYTGGSTTLTWTSDNAETCVGTNFNTNENLDGQAVVTPNSTTTYTITCTAPGGNETVSTVTVTVKKRPKFIEN